jgi:hypothetical protein
MYRITIKDLKRLVIRLNHITNQPIDTYIKIKDKYTAQIGNYHLYQAYGKVGLHQLSNEHGGVHTILELTSKRELYFRLHAFMDGILLNK